MTNNDDLSRARGERRPPLWVDAFTRNTQGLFADEIGAWNERSD